MTKSKLFPIFAALLLIVTSLACEFSASVGDVPAFEDEEPVAADPEAVVEIEESRSEDTRVSSLNEVISATVLIEAEGTFLDPADGAVNFAGRGTGFIIDPTGIAVTNNHVVTGAGLVKVWLGGEGEPKNATILGVSECSDLAVIDIEGEGYPYVDWSSEEIQRGLDVYAAGYPLGDPEFALTRGILSKLEAEGESAWASLPSVFMHDANINPGNSGGPLVDENGAVVAINYALNPDADQYFAIPQDQAREIIRILESGQDVNSIGLNGTAFVSPTGGLTGIWIASVESGSLADQAGIVPGDILTMMEGVMLSQQGTMKEYCDILKTHDLNETISFEVLRTSTDDGYLTGQLNGRPIEGGFSFGGSVDMNNSVGETSTGSQYGQYTLVTDDTGAIQMEIPSAWGDVDGGVWWFLDQIPYASIYAAPNLQEFLETWNAPGVKFNVSDEIADLGGYVEQLDMFTMDYREMCEYEGRYNYEDALYRGKYDWYYNCGGPGGANYLMLSAVPISNPTDFLIMVEVQAVNEADLDAMDQILATFQVVGVLP